MTLHPLNLVQLANVDGGRLGVAMSDALARAEADCRDRPALEKDRTIVLTLKMQPVHGDKLEILDSVDISYSINERFPKRESRSINCRALPQGGLVYSDESDAPLLDEIERAESQDKKPAAGPRSTANAR